jgi:hypothetical protein
MAKITTLFNESSGKKKSETPRSRIVNNIKIHITETWREYVK